MSEELQKVSFFMLTFILIVFAMMPLISTIETGFETTNSYYEQYEY